MCRVHGCGFRFLPTAFWGSICHEGMSAILKVFQVYSLEIHIPHEQMLFGSSSFRDITRLDNKKSEWRAAWRWASACLGAGGCSSALPGGPGEPTVSCWYLHICLVGSGMFSAERTFAVRNFQAVHLSVSHAGLWALSPSLGVPAVLGTCCCMGLL